MFKLKKVRWYLAGTMLGLFAGSAMFFFLPVQWEGQALIRIGQIASNPVEPLPTVVERLKSRSFQQAVANRANMDEISALLDVDQGAGLIIKPTKNSDSLLITIVGGSAELVHASANSIVAELISRHDAIISAYQTDIHKELSNLDLEINVLSKRLAAMLEGQAIARPKPADERMLVTGFGAMAIQHELDYKLNRSSLLRESISSANIRPTSLIECVSVSKRRVFYSTWRAFLFGALLGFSLSALLVRWKK